MADIESGRLYRGTLHKYCIHMLIPTHASSYASSYNTLVNPSDLRYSSESRGTIKGMSLCYCLKAFLSH